MSHSITFMLVICLFRSSILLDKVSYQQPKPIKIFLQQFRILSLQFYKNRERKKKESVKSLVTFQDSTLVFHFLYLITINIPTKLTTAKTQLHSYPRNSSEQNAPIRLAQLLATPHTFSGAIANADTRQTHRARFVKVTSALK